MPTCPPLILTPECILVYVLNPILATTPVPVSGLAFATALPLASQALLLPTAPAIATAHASDLTYAPVPKPGSPFLPLPMSLPASLSDLASPPCPYPYG